jgi:hypothetical protein
MITYTPKMVSLVGKYVLPTMKMGKYLLPIKKAIWRLWVKAIYVRIVVVFVVNKSGLWVKHDYLHIQNGQFGR